MRKTLVAGGLTAVAVLAGSAGEAQAQLIPSFGPTVYTNPYVSPGLQLYSSGLYGYNTLPYYGYRTYYGGGYRNYGWNTGYRGGYYGGYRYGGYRGGYRGGWRR
jgi:hypothetical protein